MNEDEKREALKQLLTYNKKLLYVFENHPQTFYTFVEDYFIYVSTVNEDFESKLTNLKVKLKSILSFEATHEQIRRIALEAKSLLEGMQNAL